LSEPSSGPTLGLRERKKARTRAAIQTHALRLFRDQGYDATTVQQIIEEAEVSESTFFRYFPTKSDVVLTDDFDPLIVEAFLGQPPQVRPVPALRAAFAAVFERLSDQEVSDQQQRMQLVLAVPELRASMLDQLASAMHLLSAVLAERTGRQPDDMAVLTVAGAVVGAVIAVTFAMGEVSTANFAARLDEAMGHLETGLEL
jgi:AcrR family transcriptional regulator